MCHIVTSHTNEQSLGLCKNICVCVRLCGCRLLFLLFACVANSLSYARYTCNRLMSFGNTVYRRRHHFSNACVQLFLTKYRNSSILRMWCIEPDIEKKNRPHSHIHVKSDEFVLIYNDCCCCCLLLQKEKATCQPAFVYACVSLCVEFST